MTKKNLVQELRELADELRNAAPPLAARCIINERFTGIGIDMCNDALFCNEHRAQALEILADRIEAEYEPRPEPDTLEDAARDMMGYMATVGESCEAPSVGVLKDFRNRLEALGAFDD